MNLQETVSLFREARPTMDEKNTPEFLCHLLTLELNELVEAVEIGQNGLIEHEVADIIFLALELANVIGFDAETAVREKSARNILKFPWQLFQEGDYLSTIDKCKEEWGSESGDNEFYSC